MEVVEKVVAATEVVPVAAKVEAMAEATEVVEKAAAARAVVPVAAKAEAMEVATEAAATATVRLTSVCAACPVWFPAACLAACWIALQLHTRSRELELLRRTCHLAARQETPTGVRPSQ